MRGRSMAVVASAGLFLAGFVAAMVARPGGDTVTLWIDDVATAGAGMVAAAALAVRAGRDRSARASWALFAVAAFCAAFGDVLWGYDELILRRDALFPSLADVSYLLFPVFAGPALLLQSARRRSASLAMRMLVDGLLVAGSLFALSWITTLGVIIRAGADSPLALDVSLAYPITDVMLLTVTVLVISHSSTRRQPAFVLIAVSMTINTVGDSFFAYLSATNTSYPQLLDALFIAAYLMLALAAYAGHPPDPDRGGRTAVRSGPAVWLPYVICSIGVGASAISLLDRSRLVPLAAAGLVVTSLVVRQLFTIVDNRRLLAQLVEREERLEHQALHDDLTGLANRALFTDRLDHALVLHAREHRPIAVLFVDLDDFKLVNDSLGHAVGDALLVRVAERLRAALRESDTVARLGGDEFAVLLEGNESPSDTAARLAEAFEMPFRIGRHSMPVRASLGLAVVDGDGQRIEADELLRRADVAMYSAKHRGKGRFVVFTPDLAHVAADEFDIREALVSAVAEGAIEVAYQPILRTGDRRLLGFEALARWQLHGTPISPEVFLSVARRLGLISALDEIVLSKALSQLAAWRRRPGYADLTCSVNADESLFESGRASSVYTAALERHGLPPSALVVELPESHLSDSPELAATVTRLREAGVAVALDDFGAHGSSLSRLHRIRVDTVKLDRDFLRPSAKAGVDEAWIGGIIDLAHRLGMTVVAEGVETPAQLTMLHALGCDAVQGFLLGRPLPAGQVRLSSPVPPQVTPSSS
jgi:diguanylate cyclase (GGDEF)-like protein